MIYRLVEIDFELNNSNEYVLSMFKIDNEARPFHNLFLISDDTTFYIDELNILYAYIIKFLCDNDIEFDYAYKNGKCSNIKAKIQGKEVYYVNFRSKFGVDFQDNYYDNLRLVEYAIAHKRVKLSIGADAYAEFLGTIFKEKAEENANYKLIREDFPVFEYDAILEEAKKNVYGFQYAVPGHYARTFDYDISGSYPANALNDTPTGLPHYYTTLEEVPKSYFKIIRFSYYDCNLKPGGIHFVKVGRVGVCCLTEALFEEFKRNYDAHIKIKQIVAFKTRKSMFTKLINQTVIAGKTLEKDALIAKYNKAVGNAIIGYLGRNTKTCRNVAKLTAQGIIYEKIEQDIEPIYLPAYLSILDKAKAKFLRTIKPYWQHIIYCNTDGFLSTVPIDLDLLNFRNANKVLGNFRQCHEFKDLFVECINGYAGITADGECINTISGMTFDKILTPDEYAAKHFVYYVNEPTAKGTIKRTAVTIN